ncbi:uncharacterized protein NPIL_664201 [Nephila pilipes]|uniref:Uncharacterized protein n=1 Tax=Nephila pilipes TaxID=299642 RepID=A0A8X6JTQ5_NEPPI|nr:uncharacterized protein NPIL_664201 [Nephila pilipes]
MKQKYWIVGAKTATRREVRRCVTCARFSSDFSKQIMADLPAARVNPGRAFLKGGMDFAGPFLITPRRGRAVKAIKVHICVFVCFTTKAVHLELASDLSAQTCIAALKRFIAKWTMNVLSAPHFGGLWKAAVKSMKFHMKRDIGSQILSQEEFSTSLAEIEAVLNSRLLVAASDEPNDFSVVAPGHFLIGSELKNVPEPYYRNHCRRII